MDALSLRDKIVGNKDFIFQIIESLGYTQIRESPKYFSFPRLDGDNLSANTLYVDSLRWQCYTRGESGNIFTLVMFTKNITSPDSLRYCAKVLGITEKELPKTTYPFGGFFKGIYKTYKSLSEADETYPETILSKYSGFSQMFFEDGVSFDVQQQFGISFSHSDNAIVIPIRNLEGGLIGVKMRSNDKNCPHEKRFWSEYNYPKTRVLYGLYQNYKKIIEKDTLVIFESEKGVLQAASIDCYVSVGIGGHNISPTQAKLIKSLMISKIIIAFDEGIDEWDIIEECTKLVTHNNVYKPKIYYIYDKDNQILSENSKDSPIDHGKTVFQKLLNTCLVKYEEDKHE